MASAWVTFQLRKSGPRYTVRYRCGGRSARTMHGGVFKDRPSAEAMCAEIISSIAGGKLPPLPKPPGQKRESLVYFGRLGDLIKIGVSVDPERRARDLNFELLHVEPGGIHYEHQLHRRFKESHVRGEWFRLAGPVRRYLRLQQVFISTAAPGGVEEAATPAGEGAA